MLDLVLVAGDGDDAVITARLGVLDADVAAGFVPDAPDAKPGLADDGACGVLGDGHLDKNIQHLKK